MYTDKSILEWDEIGGEWETRYLTNFPIQYGLYLHEAIKFFSETVNSFKTANPSFKSYQHPHDFISAQFEQALIGWDMRQQTMTALAFYEVFKIFTVEYTQFCAMVQRKNGVHASEQGISETEFLKAGRQIWAKKSLCSELDHLYTRMLLYNQFRNKIAHNLICRIQYKLNDEPLEKFLRDSLGINFDPKLGIILKHRSAAGPNKSSVVRNIYFFTGGEFVNQFCADSIKFFSLLITHCFPCFIPPSNQNGRS